jgi:hypothetical protein
LASTCQWCLLPMHVSVLHSLYVCLCCYVFCSVLYYQYLYYDCFVPCRNGEVITSPLYVNWPLQNVMKVLILVIFPRVCMQSLKLIDKYGNWVGVRAFSVSRPFPALLIPSSWDQTLNCSWFRNNATNLPCANSPCEHAR